MAVAKRRFKVKADCPVPMLSFAAASVPPVCPGDEFETADWRFLMPFDAGQVEFVEEVTPEKEAPAPASKERKSG